MPYKCQILLFFLCFSCILLAQNPHPYFRNYTTDDGLPSPEVHYCIQDTAGYMWFATDNGVSRFDGYEFKNYGPREGLKHNVVFYMQQDPDGKIWMATMHGHLYYIEGDSIRAFAQNNIIEKTNHLSDFINDFYIDSHGVKYISLIGFGILKFSPDGTFQQVLPSLLKTSILALSLPNRWVIGSQYIPNYLRSLYWNKYLKENIISPLEVFSDTTYYIDSIHLTFDQSSSCWIKSFRNNQTIGLKQSLLFEIIGKKIGRRFLPPYNVMRKAIFEKSDGSILMGQLKGGGIRMYKNVEAIFKNKFKQYLTGISISHIFQDKVGGYWISSVENGVFYCPDFDLKIYDQSTGFPNNHITAFDFKDDTTIFIGFRNGQIILFNTVENQFKKLPTLPNNIINDVLFDSTRNQLWVTNEMCNYLENGRWILLQRFSKKDRFFNPVTKKMSLGRNQKILWGGSHMGIGNFDLDQERTSPNFNGTSFSKGIKMIKEARTFRVWEDQQNRIWVGNVNGLFEYKNKKLIPPKFSHKAFQTRVEDIAELADGTLVIATKGEGVLFWKENSFHQLTTKDGLTSDMLENIYIDEQGRIWAGTLLGLNKITSKQDAFSIEKHTTFHGLPSNEITQVKSRNGQIWVATTKGLLQWKEKKSSILSTPPFFETTFVNNKPFDFSKKTNLSYQENDFEFHFLTVNYILNGKITYRFRLNDGEWNYTKNRSVNYADLPPSNYQFEVQSQNENDIWSTSNFLSFEIQAAFWQTRWFTFLGIGTLLGLGWLVYHNQLQKIQHDAQVKNEINELQRAALRAQMNPHFIFNCLNSIQNFIVKNDSKNATIYLAKFAQLVRGTLNASMLEKIALEDEINLLENYLNLEKLRFKDKFDYKIHVEKELQTFDIMLPPLLSQPFVENALVHGFSKENKTVQIDIYFKKNKDTLEIYIQDNGLGIFKSQQRKTSSTQSHRGIGMNISQKRLELANTLNELEVKEIKNTQGEIKGTVIKMILKCEATQNNKLPK